ncbi:MAG: GTPase ObgE [Chloroflexi bacterium]|nr:GTPase ObgE [Chloroflexota bacterium]
MFYDQAKIHVKAGDGGDGSAHMRREKYVPRGGPDGGDGGRGGSVYLEGDPSMNTLLAFRYKRHFKAAHGGPGGKSRRHGAAGDDLVVKVPLGTVVRDAATGEVLGDIVEPNQRLLVARGGRGGLGNVHFATATQRAPEFAQKGEPGEEREIALELRVISDVGLVGYPNAGKSSLLAAISAARPKIAAYPFTTLEPNLGVVGIDEASFVVADIPGLIEGAHEGTGLGLQFLRHVERTKLLIHVLDAAGTEGRDPLEDFERINVELAQYSAELAKRPQIVAANKMDLPEARERWPRLKQELAQRGVPAFPISAATREGIEPLLRAIAEKLAEIRREEAEAEAARVAAAGVPAEFVSAPDHRVYTPLEESREFTVEQLGDELFQVSGTAVERLIAMTDLESEPALRHLQQRLRQLGVTQALEEAGVRPGNTVMIGDVELEWQAPGPPPRERRTAKQRKASIR